MGFIAVYIVIQMAKKLRVFGDSMSAKDDEPDFLEQARQVMGMQSRPSSSGHRHMGYEHHRDMSMPGVNQVPFQPRVPASRQ